jgi:hypothetical protein
MQQLGLSFLKPSGLTHNQQNIPSAKYPILLWMFNFGAAAADCPQFDSQLFPIDIRHLFADSIGTAM